MAFKGRNIFLRVLIGSIYTTIAGLQSKTISISRDSVDITTEDEAPWRQLLSDTGMANLSISANGIFKDDAAMNLMEDYAVNGTIGTFQILFENGDSINGDFQVTSFEYSTEVGNALVSSISLESATVQTLLRSDATPELVSLQQAIICPQANGQCGSDVSIYGDTLAVGALNMNGVGAVRIYTRTGTTWTFQQEITGSIPGGRFGNAVSLYEDTLAVGAYTWNVPAVNTNIGAVYIFTRAGGVWTEQQKLANPVTYNQEQLGWSVSLYKDTVIAGMPGRAERGTGTGGATIWKRTGTVWTVEASLLMTGSVYGSEHFGSGVAVYEDTVAVGCYGEVTTGGSRTGVVYVFTRTGSSWLLQAKIDADSSTKQGGEQLGFSVDLYMDRIVAGANYRDTANLSDGAVYTFTRVGSSWSQEQLLIPANPAVGAQDQIGTKVAIDDDTIIMSGRLVDVGAVADVGEAYRYVLQNGVWVEKQTLRDLSAGVAPVNTGGDNFGRGVDVYNNTAVVGALGYDVTSNQGAAFVYR